MSVGDRMWRPGFECQLDGAFFSGLEAWFVAMVGNLVTSPAQNLPFWQIDGSAEGLVCGLYHVLPVHHDEAFINCIQDVSIKFFTLLHRLLGSSLLNDQRDSAAESVQHGIFIGRNGVLGKEGHNSYCLTVRDMKLVSRKRHQSQIARPFVVMNARIILNVIGEELVLL